MKNSVVISAILLVLLANNVMAGVLPKKPDMPKNPLKKKEVVSYSTEEKIFLQTIEDYYHETFDSAVAHVGEADEVKTVVVRNKKGDLIIEAAANKAVLPTNAKLIMVLDRTAYYLAD